VINVIPKLTRLEHRVMDVIWDGNGPVSIREVQEAFPEKTRPAYSTVQTIVYRLEAKKAVRRVRKIVNAHVFEATISRTSQQRRLIAELLGLFRGRGQPIMEHLIEAGGLTLDDIRDGEQLLRRLEKKGKAR
jgi:BlaI family penicillinase repressor